MANDHPPDKLCGAIRAGDAAKVRALLEHHPELKQRLDQPIEGGHFGATALLTAVQEGRREVAEVLLDAGASINQRSHWWAGGFGVLDGESPLVPWLIERGARVDAYAAARHGMMDRLAALVAAHPSSVQLRGGDGQTPLHVARTVEVARFLLDHGADIDAVDVDHESTPAQYLVQDHPDVARFLVERGCRTDIFLLAALGDTARAELLLDADPNVVRMTISENFFPMKNPRAGGTIYFWTLGRYLTPHAVARKLGHDDVHRLLMERSPDDVRLAEAADRGDTAQVGELLKRGTRARTHTPAERRRIADAACNNNTEAVRLMLEAGWPADARGQNGGTPLHWAAWHGNVAMVRELLRHDAPVDLRDEEYDGMAIDWARHGSENGWEEGGDHASVIRLLREAGASEPSGG